MQLPFLADLAATDAEATGGKAANLARLAAAGFRVPSGFVVPAPEIAALDSEPGPGALHGAIASALERLAPERERVAVRSSALDEDGAERSFAGQHATILNVSGPEAVISAVHECASSLHHDSASAYRAATGAERPAGIAVLVQRMVAAEAAGVAFTLDPATGDTSRIVVDAVPGLGEDLVAGLAEPHRFVFAREGLRLLEEDAAAGRALSIEQARDVAELALRCEAFFGSPQDIEFALDADGAWLLQSRPVTGARAAPGPGEFDSPTTDADLWTSANIGEVLPGLLTPLAITAFAASGNEAYSRAYQQLKILGKRERPAFVGFFYNRAFLHVGNTRLIAERTIGGSGDVVEARFLGGENGAATPSKHTWSHWKHRLLSAIPLLWMTRTIVKRGEKADRETRAFERRLRKIDVTKLSGAEIDDMRLEISAFVARTFAIHLQSSGCAGAGYDLVARMVRPILKERTEGRVPALFAGMPDVESARISLDLWDLSRIAESEGIGGRLRDPAFDPADSSLPSRWRTAFRAFLDQHGHRGLFEMEPAQPSWRQDPRPVLAIIADYLDLDPAHSPSQVLARREVERLELTARLERRMNPLKRAVFRSVLRDAQRWVALREQTKSVIVRGTRLVDLLVPEGAARVVASGTIATADDIFFLTGDELALALRSGSPPDFRAAVTRRRRDFERNRYVQLPERFWGQPVPLAPDASAVDAAVLNGTPVSPGQVTARARVIRDPRVDDPLKPGEILVAPVTDAGWTPLFALASGLVVDMGSALSHGSTVAREYGLPAVVNVRTGTTAIRTGDLIAIDGAAGTVTIVERAKAS